ncbi:MAG: PQQ-like beta-propeller repeat protein [Thermosipho sp. (in: Bacteria)]|nr:PQQ-like beta-propeller repeat protein [Thermosipho sp. (in: thermotogales)]
MRRSVLLIFFIAILLSLSSCISEYTSSVGTLKWKLELGSFFTEVALGQDKTIYVGFSSSKESQLLAINPNGTLKWKYVVGNNEEILSWRLSRPAIDNNGNIYILYNYSIYENFEEKRLVWLYAINPNGTLKWKLQINKSSNYVESFSAPSIGLDGTIFVTSRTYDGYWKGYLNAINPDGSVKWVYNNSDQIAFQSLAIDQNGSIYFSVNDYNATFNYLIALNSDGSLKWEYETKESIGSPSIGSDGTLYFSSYDVSNKEFFLCAMNSDGIIKWKTQVENGVSQPIIGINETLYSIGRLYNKYNVFYVYAFNSDGSLKWKTLIDEECHGGLTLGNDGTIYVIGEHSVYAIDSEGTVKWKYTTNRLLNATIAIDSNGVLYIGSNTTLYAIQSESTGLAKTAWPKSWHDNQNTGNSAFQTN